MSEYKGKDIDIAFDGKRCIHARNCVMTLPKVFEANAPGPWIHPDANTADQIASMIMTCPSGALTFTRHDGGMEEDAPEVNTARVLENGPVAIRGPLMIDDEETGLRATLCRCGASKNKPFCDGSHKAAGFEATGEPETQDSEPLEVRDGQLKITSIKNGPLKVEGNLEVLSGT
ncbi:MAG: (4Fe-4S)-binding protein, partial [Myxococcota bacterium]